MIAKQTVFLNQDRTRAVVESDPEAKFLLCRAGTEIPDVVANRYDGAVALLGAEAKKAAPSADMLTPPPLVMNRNPVVATKDPAPAAAPAKGRKPKGAKPKSGKGTKEEPYQY